MSQKDFANVDNDDEGRRICPECGQHYSNHNDDGSCVDDELEKEEIRKKFDADLAHADFLYDQWREREIK